MKAAERQIQINYQEFVCLVGVSSENMYRMTQKKREILKNPTKIEEIQEKKLWTEIEPL